MHNAVVKDKRSFAYWKRDDVESQVERVRIICKVRDREFARVTRHVWHQGGDIQCEMLVGKPM